MFSGFRSDVGSDCSASSLCDLHWFLKATCDCRMDRGLAVSMLLLALVQVQLAWVHLLMLGKHFSFRFNEMAKLK